MPNRRPTHRASFLLFLAALVHLCRNLAALTTLSFGITAVVQRDGSWLGFAAIALVIWAIFALIHAFEGGRCNCAVCNGRLFISTRNSKHETARRVLGSYPLHTALQVLFTSAYRCQHCGTAVNALDPDGGQPAPAKQKRMPRSRRARIPAAGNGGQPAIVLHAKTNGLLKKNKKTRR